MYIIYQNGDIIELRHLKTETEYYDLIDKYDICDIHRDINCPSTIYYVYNNTDTSKRANNILRKIKGDILILKQTKNGIVLYDKQELKELIDNIK